MAINKAMRLALKALSYRDIDVKKFRNLAELKTIDPFKAFYKTIDYKIYNGDYEVPTRIYFPNEQMEDCPVLFFIHGGGWVTESVETYNRVCANMAKYTGHAVVSVDYRLAPEYHFPIGLLDCYTVAKAIYTKRFILNVDPDKITVIGDSAGGNLAAAVCLMARDKGEFFPKKQILIYPCTNNDYTESSVYPSIKENGEGYLLTAKRLNQYMEMYQSSAEDRNNPYFAPIIASNLEKQPETLIITAEYDPLRDEGEDYGKRLQEAGNRVEIHRIPDALHGFFALGVQYSPVKKSYELINQFLAD